MGALTKLNRAKWENLKHLDVRGGVKEPPS